MAVPLLETKLSSRSVIALTALASGILIGGIMLILFGTNVVPVDNDDIIDRLVGYRFDVFTVVAGAVLVATSGLLVPWIVKLKKYDEVLRLSVNHHLRNSLQVVMGDLELAGQEDSCCPQLATYVNEAKTACGNVIKILEDLTDSKQESPHILPHLQNHSVNIKEKLHSVQ